ncbi:hypothetical protein N658DRAFT_569505 [Parathielavia hyrcaniae]|uniref:Uncharacterized protein n=1 Tax=Parathielavia hyrcaniae TaxID=113614 RepID=A0AAN6PSH2_9PEZI|nr:hypothetical protein N658DRAFT_569505 [Parathielavia hyrcaniae]
MDLLSTHQSHLASRLPHSSPIPIFRKECRRDRLTGIWAPALAALGSIAVNFSSNRASQSHGGELSCAFIVIRQPFFTPALSDEPPCCWPLRSGAAGAPATAWADRRHPSSSHPSPGGRPFLPMSPHGKRLWSEAARRAGTLDLVLWS